MAAEDLVPTNQDYGERQETVGMMKRAGLPVQSTAGAPRPGLPNVPNFPVVRPANPEFDPLDGRTPQDYPFLQRPMGPRVVPTREGGVQTDPDAGGLTSPWGQLSSQAKSAFVRAVLARLAAGTSAAVRNMPPFGETPPSGRVEDRR